VATNLTWAIVRAIAHRVPAGAVRVAANRRRSVNGSIGEGAPLAGGALCGATRYLARSVDRTVGLALAVRTPVGTCGRHLVSVTSAGVQCVGIPVAETTIYAGVHRGVTVVAVAAL